MIPELCGLVRVRYVQSSLIHLITSSMQLYVTENLGQTWTKIADYVDNPSDYQW